jgi:hypothetical protein
MSRGSMVLTCAVLVSCFGGCPDPDPRDDDDSDPPGPQDDDDDVADDDDSSPGTYCYQEDLTADANLSDLDLDYDAETWLDTMLSALHRRYPEGLLFVEQIQADPSFGDALDTTDFTTMMTTLPDAIADQTLSWNADHGHQGADEAYWVTSTWQPRVPLHEGFPRSELVTVLPDETTATYRERYLTGDAGLDDLGGLLDDLDAQINRLAMAAVVGDYIDGNVDIRDETLALMFFVQMYLGLARTDHEDYYAEIHSEQVMLDLVTILWLKLQYFLDVSYTHDNLGLDEDPIKDHIAAEPNMTQLEQFVGLQLAASPCLPEGQSYTPPF